MVLPHKAILLFDEENVNSITSINVADFIVIDSTFNLESYITLFDQIEFHQCIVIVSIEKNNNLYKLIPHDFEIHIKSSLNETREIFECFLKKGMSNVNSVNTLTRNESNVLLRSLCHISVKKISRELNMPEKTVYMHRMNACKKLGFRKAYEFYSCQKNDKKRVSFER